MNNKHEHRFMASIECFYLKFRSKKSHKIQFFRLLLLFMCFSCCCFLKIVGEEIRVNKQKLSLEIESEITITTKKKFFFGRGYYVLFCSLFQIMN